MNEVLIIGPTIAITNCHIHSDLQLGEKNNAKISSINSGGCFYLAISLSQLGVHTNYVTRLSEDAEAQKLWLSLDTNNVLVYSCGKLHETPKEFNIIEQGNRKTTLQQATLDIYPNDPTNIPSLVISRADYAFVDLIDSNFLSYLVYRYPNTKWISKRILSDTLLPSIEGIYLPYEDALDIIDEDNFVELANRLLGKGAKWLIIPKNEKGIYFFSSFTTYFYEFGLQKQENLTGLYEYYLALLLTCLVRGIDIEQAIVFANEQFIANLTSAN